MPYLRHITRHGYCAAPRLARGTCAALARRTPTDFSMNDFHFSLFDRMMTMAGRDRVRMSQLNHSQKAPTMSLFFASHRVHMGQGPALWF
jgi:hypothetical protein